MSSLTNVSLSQSSLPPPAVNPIDRPLDSAILCSPVLEVKIKSVFLKSVDLLCFILASDSFPEAIFISPDWIAQRNAFGISG